MKNILFGFVLVLAVIVGGTTYWLSNNMNTLLANELPPRLTGLVGSRVAIDSIDLSLIEGRLEINGLSIANPNGFSPQNAIRFKSLALEIDVLSLFSSPITINRFALVEPEVLVEVHTDLQTNINQIINNLKSNQPSQPNHDQAPTEANANQRTFKLIRIDNFIIDQAQLTLDLSAFQQRSQTLRLPALSIEPIGQPDGVPVDDVARLVLLALLEDAKKQASEAARDAAEDKAKESLEKKARDLLKGLFDR